MTNPPSVSPKPEQGPSSPQAGPGSSAQQEAPAGEQGSSLQEDGRFHTYTTHRIPWWVRAMWIAFWIGAIWYMVKYTIPMTRNYF
jgi:hypothetical protein